MDSKAWYAPYISTAKELGWICSEIGDINIYPDKSITREEAAYLVSKWLDSRGKNSYDYRFMNVFSDVNEISEWAAESIQKVYNAGIMEGDENKKMKPFDNMTRAEAARMIASALEK